MSIVMPSRWLSIALLVAACAEDAEPLGPGASAAPLDAEPTPGLTSEDAGRGDTSAALDGGDDAGEPTDGGASPGGEVRDVGELLRLSVTDLCKCVPRGFCCPEFTVRLVRIRGCFCFLACGDAEACEPTPIAWERLGADGGWTTTTPPSEAGAGPFCESRELSTESLVGAGSIGPAPDEPGTYRVRALLAEYEINPSDACLPNRVGTVSAVSNAITLPLED